MRCKNGYRKDKSRYGTGRWLKRYFSTRTTRKFNLKELDAGGEMDTKEMSDKMKELEQKVYRFNSLQLPGQPMATHMGTYRLVNELWRELQKLYRECVPNEEKEEKSAKKFIVSFTRDYHVTKEWFADGESFVEGMAIYKASLQFEEDYYNFINDPLNFVLVNVKTVGCNEGEGNDG